MSIPSNHLGQAKRWRTVVAMLGLSLFVLPSGRSADAGDLFHKLKKNKGQLIAVPVQSAAPAAVSYAPAQAMSTVPMQSVQWSVTAVPSSMSYVQPMQSIVMVPVSVNTRAATAQPAQAQVQAAPAPNINITVVEAPAPAQAQAQAAPTAQTQSIPQAIPVHPQAQAPVQVQAVPGVSYGATAAYAMPNVPQAVPMQLYYVPSPHRCSIFCRH